MGTDRQRYCLVFRWTDERRIAPRQSFRARQRLWIAGDEQHQALLDHSSCRRGHRPLFFSCAAAGRTDVPVMEGIVESADFDCGTSRLAIAYRDRVVVRCIRDAKMAHVRSLPPGTYVSSLCLGADGESLIVLPCALARRRGVGDLAGLKTRTRAVLQRPATCVETDSQPDRDWRQRRCPDLVSTRRIGIGNEPCRLAFIVVRRPIVICVSSARSSRPSMGRQGWRSCDLRPGG